MRFSIVHTILSYSKKIANIGITQDLDFQEKSRTQILNIVVTIGIPISLFFTILNFSENRHLLASINFLTFLNGVIILITNSYQKYQAARVILNFFCSFLFCAGSIIYRNGTEYGILANIIVSIVFFRDKRILIFLTLYNCILFIGIKVFLLSPYIFSSVPPGRVIFNTAWCILMILLSLFFLKSEQDDYLKIIEEKNKELEKINANKEKLFSIIAHDLRSPLGQLKSLIDLVNEQVITPAKFQQLSLTLAKEVDRLHTTMDNLLKWSMSQSQGIRAIPEKLVLAPQLEETLFLFQQKINNKNVTVTIEDNLPEAILCDKNHLLLILRNLLSNAIKYSNPETKIIIRSYANNQQGIIQFIDQGKGMNAETVANIFSAQQIISTPGTSNEKGTGLGLKLCKEFVEANNGNIWITSEENKGSTFSFSLPLAK